MVVDVSYTPTSMQLVVYMIGTATEIKSEGDTRGEQAAGGKLAGKKDRGTSSRGLARGKTEEQRRPS